MKLILRQKIRDTRQDGCIRMLVSLLTVSGKRKRRTSLVDPVAKTQFSQCRGHGFGTGSGNYDPVWCSGKKK